VPVSGNEQRILASRPTNVNSPMPACAARRAAGWRGQLAGPAKLQTCLSACRSGAFGAVVPFRSTPPAMSAQLSRKKTRFPAASRRKPPQRFCRATTTIFMAGRKG